MSSLLKFSAAKSPPHSKARSLFPMIYFAALVAVQATRAVEPDLQAKEDRSKWRLVKPHARIYADERAVQDYRRYTNEKRKWPVRRMDQEDRCYKLSGRQRVEVIEDTNEGFSKVRPLRPPGKRMFMIAASDLLPYDPKAERTDSEVEAAERARDERSKKDRLMVGKRVRIVEGAFAFRDVDTVWETVEAAEEGTGHVGKIEELVRQSRIISVGKDSTGVVNSTGGPRRRWAYVESHINGKEEHLWVRVTDIAKITSLPDDEAAKASGQDEKTELPRVKATTESLMRKILAERLDRVEVYAHVTGGVNVLEPIPKPL